MRERAGSGRATASSTPPGLSALAAAAFDLDEHDVVALDDVETMDDTWVLADEDTVIELEPDTADLAPPPRGYAPGLSDDEVDAIIVDLTHELCSPARPRARSRHRG